MEATPMSAAGELVNKMNIQWNNCIQALPFLSNGVPLFQRLLLWLILPFPLENKICYFWLSALYTVFIYNWPIGFKPWFYFRTSKYSWALFTLSFSTSIPPPHNTETQTHTDFGSHSSLDLQNSQVSYNTWGSVHCLNSCDDGLMPLKPWLYIKDQEKNFLTPEQGQRMIKIQILYASLFYF